MVFPQTYRRTAVAVRPPRGGLVAPAASPRCLRATCHTTPSLPGSAASSRPLRDCSWHRRDSKFSPDTRPRTPIDNNAGNHGRGNDSDGHGRGGGAGSRGPGRGVGGPGRAGGPGGKLPLCWDCDVINGKPKTGGVLSGHVTADCPKPDGLYHLRQEAHARPLLHRSWRECSEGSDTWPQLPRRQRGL